MRLVSDDYMLAIPTQIPLQIQQRFRKLANRRVSSKYYKHYRQKRQTIFKILNCKSVVFSTTSVVAEAYSSLWHRHDQNNDHPV